MQGYAEKERGWISELGRSMEAQPEPSGQQEAYTKALLLVVSSTGGGGPEKSGG